MTDLVPVPAAPASTPPWQSKTLWAAVLTAALPFFPPAQAFALANPHAVALAIGVVFSVLRLMTNKPVGMP